MSVHKKSTPTAAEPTETTTVKTVAPAMPICDTATKSGHNTLVKFFKELSAEHRNQMFIQLRGEFHQAVHVDYKTCTDPAKLPAILEVGMKARNQYACLVEATDGRNTNILGKMDRNLANIDRGAAFKKVEAATPVESAPAKTEEVKAKKAKAS